MKATGHRSNFTAAALAFVMMSISLLSTGCRSSKPPSPPPPPASFVKPVVQRVFQWDEYSGRLESPQVVNLSARVSGIITQAPFQEGSLVNAGDTLFVIDERPFVAELRSKEADILSAQAQLSEAQRRFNRYRILNQTKAISAEDYDQAAATLQQAEARLESAGAARDIAKLNAEWTRVLAPISGRISRKFVTEGNLVTGGTGQATLLTIITSVDPMYCYVSAPEGALLKYRSLNEGRRLGNNGPGLPCQIQLENEKGFGHEGRIDFVDNRIDRMTGTVEVRCTIPNADGFLSSGLFARMRVLGSEPFRAVLVPDNAIGTDQSSRFVLVIGPDDVVVRKNVEPGPLFGSLRRMIGGVDEGDRVIINGLQQLRPGTKVAPQEGVVALEALHALEEYSAGPDGISISVPEGQTAAVKS